MFFVTCKITCKNIFRTTTFWLIVLIMFLVACNHASSACYGMYMPEYDEVIMDTDPRFVLEYQRYIIHITNALATLLNYAAPILAVVSATLIARRDYGDSFFEIEKSTKLRYLQYLLGKMLPLILIIFGLVTLCSFFSLHFYVFLRDGVAGMGLRDYLIDSTVRLLRASIMRTFPCITIYITLTYGVATIFKNNIVAAIAGLGYVLTNMVLSLYLLAAESFYNNYLSPAPLKIMQYLYYYDTEWFGTIPILNTSFSEILFCFGCSGFLSLLFSLISYFRIRKRTV